VFFLIVIINGGLSLNEDLKNMLWIGAFRYWCGRQTISVHSFCDEIIKEWGNIPAQAKGVILRNLRDAITSDDRDREENRIVRTLGHNIDREKWLEVFAFINFK